MIGRGGRRSPRQTRGWSRSADADVIADVSDILVHVLTAAVRESDAHARVRLVELVGQQRGVGHGALGLELFLLTRSPRARRTQPPVPPHRGPAEQGGPPQPRFSYDEQRAAVPEAVSRSDRATEYPDLHPSASAERWRHPVSAAARDLYVSRVPGQEISGLFFTMRWV